MQLQQSQHLTLFLYAEQNAIVNCGCSGAVAQDGRIEPGDMILEVNSISFENMTNDEAVQTLRSAAQRPGYVTVTNIAM